MAFAAAIGPIVSGIASMAGAMASASAANQQAEGERAAGEYNRIERYKKAAWLQSKGAADSAEKTKEYERAAATARAVQAAGGLATTEGSPLLSQMKFGEDERHKTNIIMANAITEQRQEQARGDIEKFQADVKANATQAQGQAGLLSGGVGLVGGVGKAFSSGASFG
jgi:hypothetical protein